MLISEPPCEKSDCQIDEGRHVKKRCEMWISLGERPEVASLSHRH